MTTPNERLDLEIARLSAERDKIRTSISEMTEDNVSGASFEDRAINHLPLTELREIEADYNIKISDLVMQKQGYSYIFGNVVEFTTE